MAIRNSSIVPFKVTSIPDRYTPVYALDMTVVATTAGTGAVKRLNRLQSGSFAMSTNVTDIVEMGSQYRPGGIDDLGELKWNLSWNAVGVGNMATLTGKTVPTAPGSSLSIGQNEINAANIDLIRLVADVNGTVFGTLYMPDCIIDDYSVDAKEKGVVTESASGRGPAAVFFPGFVIPKVYVAQAADVTAGYLTVSSVLGADESIVRIFNPAQGQPPSYFQQNGSNYFLKIEKVPGGNTANAPVRYFEHVMAKVQAAITAGTTYITPDTFNLDMLQVGQQVTVGVGTANKETVTITAIALTANTNSGTSTVAAAGSATITPASMQGIVVGASLTCVNSDNTNSELITVTAVTGTTFTATFASTKTAGFTIKSAAPSFQATFTKTHAVGDFLCGALVAAQANVGNAGFDPSTNKLYLGDAFVAGDAFRLVVMSYNTDSFPTTIPVNSPDTAERAAVATRLVPLQINGLKADRVQSAAFKMALKRDHVQGIGENKNVYGISSVPDVSVDLDVKETDLSLLSQLQTGSKNLSAAGGNIQNDFEDLNYITRNNLANPVPASITLLDPFDASHVLCKWSTPQVVVKDINYSSTNKADNTIKVSAMDITGNFTITLTNPN